MQHSSKSKGGVSGSVMRWQWSPHQAVSADMTGCLQLRAGVRVLRAADTEQHGLLPQLLNGTLLYSQ